MKEKERESDGAFSLTFRAGYRSLLFRLSNLLTFPYLRLSPSSIRYTLAGAIANESTISSLLREHANFPKLSIVGQSRFEETKPSFPNYSAFAEKLRNRSSVAELSAIKGTASRCCRCKESFGWQDARKATRRVKHMHEGCRS